MNTTTMHTQDENQNLNSRLTVGRIVFIALALAPLVGILAVFLAR